MPPLLHFPITKTNYKSIEEEIFSFLSISTTFHHLTQLQAKVFTSGLHQNNFIATKLLNLCSSTSSISHALLIFHHIKNPSISLFNSLIRALSQHNHPLQALHSYSLMKHAQIPPDNFTFPSLLKASLSLPSPSPPLGGAVHGEVIRTGFEPDRYIRVSLINMYSKLGCVESARYLFDEMPVRDFAVWNSMIAGFFRIEDVEKGRELFDRMPERNVVSWNTVVVGYAQNGQATEALRLFRRMQAEGVRPNKVTLLGALSACAQAGALDVGRWAHRYIENSGIGMDVLLGNCLIDMYAKGGSLSDARQVFDGMSERSVVSWNCMISALAMHGLGEDAVSLFESMDNEGVEPDDITFLGVLSACAHAGLIDKGRSFFDSMVEEHGMAPKLEHYGCMVDLLSRGGCLIEAHELIRRMPIPPDACIWGALLGACRTHGYLELAELAAGHLLELEPWNPGNYVLLSNVYAARGHWDNVVQVWEKMRGRLVQKTPGSSAIEIESYIHEFVTGDRSHPCSDKDLGNSHEESLGRRFMWLLDDVDDDT
ncbi:Pentatricopeptide repeat [Cinnamomum micranthum f. kanehirae]|uniref:Pentatricopeptide repeat n=1 Tax=Cinnamomum micranthum f. kanehirae TaxID=337451 RepID=A0A3S4N5D4_9MAGN|nr:Pentatricopeptide repeat [Cinnamomum micranthum f. kanehirae]